MVTRYSDELRYLPSLIGWMTTHPDAPEARELGAEYVGGTVELSDQMRQEID